MLFGGDKRDRTADLLTASQALSQLSYTPMPFYFHRSVRLGTSDNIAQGVETVNTFLRKFLLFQKVFCQVRKASYSQDISNLSFSCEHRIASARRVEEVFACDGFDVQAVTAAQQRERAVAHRACILV